MGRRRGKGGITAPGQSKQSSRSFFSGSHRRHVKTQFYPLMWLSNTYIMNSGCPKPLTTPTPSSLPPFPFKSAPRLPSNININSQKDQRRGSSCAPFIKALMSHISGYPTGTHTHAHAHTYAHTHRHTDTAIYCAYGQAEHIRHIKLEDAIKRVKSIASARVCVCVCDSFLCICGTHTHM